MEEGGERLRMGKVNGGSRLKEDRKDLGVNSIQGWRNKAKGC